MGYLWIIFFSVGYFTLLFKEASRITIMLLLKQSAVDYY